MVKGRAGELELHVFGTLEPEPEPEPLLSSGAGAAKNVQAP